MTSLREFYDENLCPPGAHFILPEVSLFGHGYVCMFSLMVNSYGHVGMVSSP